MCGVSARTIQRIERSGTSSAESRLALAAVFEVDASHFDPVPEASCAPSASQTDNPVANVAWVLNAQLLQRGAVAASMLFGLHGAVSAYFSGALSPVKTQLLTAGLCLLWWLVDEVIRHGGLGAAAGQWRQQWRALSSRIQRHR